jgi:hypothetical protein
LTSGDERRDSDRRKSSSSLRERRGYSFFLDSFQLCDASLLGIYKKQTKEEEAGSSPEKTGLLIQKKIRKHFYPNPK